MAGAIAEFGRVDSLVNAAGLTTRGTLLDTTPELFDAHIAINLRAPFFLMQAVVANLVVPRAPGTIVNIITSSEHGGQPYLAPYVAAKAGLAGLTRNAAHAHRWDRIRINGLNIGWTDTEGEDATQRTFHDAGDDWREQAAASVPMGKLGQLGRDRGLRRVPAVRPQRGGHRLGHRLVPPGLAPRGLPMAAVGIDRHAPVRDPAIACRWAFTLPAASHSCSAACLSQLAALLGPARHRLAAGPPPGPLLRLRGSIQTGRARNGSVRPVPRYRRRQQSVVGTWAHNIETGASRCGAHRP